MIQLKDAILKHVQENSGGVKFIDLLTGVAAGSFEKTIDFPEGVQFGADFPDQLLDFVRQMSELKVLEYSWDMGGTKRIKYFIYTA